MGRKVREYKSRQYYIDKMNEYIDIHKNEILAYLLEHEGCKTVEELSAQECSMHYGFDCGWCLIYPRNMQQSHEWELDHGRYENCIRESHLHLPFGCQSTTIKVIELKYILVNTNLLDELSCQIHLD